MHLFITTYIWSAIFGLMKTQVSVAKCWLSLDTKDANEVSVPLDHRGAQGVFWPWETGETLKVMKKKAVKPEYHVNKHSNEWRLCQQLSYCKRKRKQHNFVWLHVLISMTYGTNSLSTWVHGSLPQKRLIWMTFIKPGAAGMFGAFMPLQRGTTTFVSVRRSCSQIYDCD